MLINNMIKNKFAKWLGYVPLNKFENNSSRKLRIDLKSGIMKLKKKANEVSVFDLVIL